MEGTACEMNPLHTGQAVHVLTEYHMARGQTKRFFSALSLGCNPRFGPYLKGSIRDLGPI